jgi:hypothetical protein
MSRGTNEQFDELHGLTLTILTTTLKAAARGMLVDEEGQVTMIPPALLAQAIKFLKENGIDKPAAPTKKTDTLKDAMPDFDELEGGNVVPIRR